MKHPSLHATDRAVLGGSRLPYWVVVEYPLRDLEQEVGASRRPAHLRLDHALPHHLIADYTKAFEIASPLSLNASQKTDTPENEPLPA